MFTGIVEEVGKVLAVSGHGTNRDLMISARMTPELKVDQSVSHNGVCLTVVRIDGDRYMVTAVQETLDRSNIGSLSVGDPVNLERSLRVGDRLDGHMVQGHVDTVVECTLVEDVGGSWRYRFSLPERPEMLVLKGSICINGVSLTIAELDQEGFGVAIIPYTREHTSFHALDIGHRANIEYDILGKYVERMVGARVTP